MLIGEKLERQQMAANAARNNDYSAYGFRFDCGSLEAQDTEMILILLTVCKCIDCKTVKSQIKGAIEHNQLKEMLIQDVLMEANENL